MNYIVRTNATSIFYPESSYGKILQTLLFNLNLNAENIEAYLNYAATDFESPFNIFGMEKAVQTIEKAIAENKKIVIHGDFDVDGVCATSILWDYLYRKRKVNCIPIIPNRVDEGYGLSDKTIEKAIKEKADLIITVDCGIKDFDIVEKYKDRIDFVITDHHQFLYDEKGKIKLPQAKAVVHSAHSKSKFSTMISGAATAWQLVRALDIKDKNFDLKSDSINQYLDLVSLSTVCDVIPLTVENKKLIKKGIIETKKNNRKGLKELFRIARVDLQKLDTYHYGFVIGPRINACSRITNDAMDALRLLVTSDQNQAQNLAIKLNDLNIERQNLTANYLEKAESLIDHNKKVIVILDEEWPEGILGLVAGRLAEKYFKPVFVASINKEGKITGSSRSSLENFHLNKALDYAKDYLTRFGGHKQAAGFASEVEKFKGFEDKIIEYIDELLSDEDFERVSEISIAFDSFEEIYIKDVEELSLLEPHGIGNPRPLFKFDNLVIDSFSYLGKVRSHLKLNVRDINSKSLEAIGFNLAESFRDKIFIGQNINLIGYLGINEFNGVKKVQIEIKDIIFSD